LSNTSSCCRLGIGRPVFQKSAHQQIFLNRHLREHRLVLQNIGDARFGQFL
jgi:hypothetical protein